LILAILALAAGAALPLRAAPREALWKGVDEAVQKGLPRTAITNLDLIIPAAIKDRAHGEAAKAIARKIVLEGNIQGNKAEEKITRMEAEMAKAPREIVPLLDAIVANWYWHYFQNNRWRFMQRTQTAQAPGKDFTTWDLPRLFAEIDKQFGKALAGADTLKKTPIATFDELLQKGTVPDTYRPTLYDFIAHEALKFYTSGEQAAAKPEDAFELFSDKPVHGIAPLFGTAEEFVAGKIERRADESAAEKAFFLFRDLLLFHRNDKDPSAFADADLARLVWANNAAFGEDKAARYKAALKTFVDKWADHELSALAISHWARVIQGEGDLVEARRLAQRGANAHRASIGGRMCRNLISEIEARAASITTERVWNAPWPAISVSYRNLTNVHFRAVAYDWNAFLDKRRNRPEYLSAAERRELLAKAPALVWSTNLPPTPDFKERAEELPAPATLKPGFYFLIASHDRDFTDKDNQVTFTDVWVSDLALVVRPHNRNIEGFVLEANSGEPIQGGEVMAWHLDNNGNRVPTGPAARTDENGFFSIRSAEHRGSLLRVRAKIGDTQHELGSMQEYYSYQMHQPEPNEQTVFFTDRALYRPGQTVQYKGICLRVDQSKDNYETLAGRKLTVVFSDPNGKEIAKAEHQCNDYGSFSGSFNAPRDRLMGRMTINVPNGPFGQASFNIEEYKRPKFQVTLDAPKTAAKLNDLVSLQGKAESYTGAAVDGALVKYRVVREVRWPYWWGWYSWRAPRVQQGSQEIAHGTARTETDGTFKIEFNAKPDPSVSEKDEASFSFSIHADVTDTTGETRSARRGVNVGFTALQATLGAGEWLTEDKPVALSVRTTTLDWAPQAAEGLVKVNRLKEPAQVQRAALGGGYNRWGGEASGPKPDLSNPNQWELADVAAEKGFTTDAEGNAKLEFKLAPGVYRAMLETQDLFGKRVTARLPLQVLKPDDTKLAIKIPRLLAAPKWSLEPGEELTALWGTGYDAGRAFIEFEHRNQMVERYWTKPGQTQQQIKRAVTEAMRGGFTLHVTQVRENRAYLQSRHIDVPWSNKNLDLKWEHFTSKLGPAQKETWTLAVSNRQSTIGNRQSATAELVATLYDESLDQYLGHSWQQRFGFFRYDYSQRHGDFANVTKGFQHLMGNWQNDYVGVELRYRQFPQDLVANFWGYQFARGNRFRAASALGGVAQDSTEMSMGAPMPASAPAEANFADASAERAGGGKLAKAKDERQEGKSEDRGSGANAPDLSQVTARKNLNETAFFIPQLISDQDGVVKLQFTMPEALTTWRFMGFAHDKQVRSGFLEGKAVTAKDLMVQPNPPRFLREGDTLEFTAKVSNQTTNRQQGKVKLTLNYAVSERSADQDLGNAKNELDFDIPARESRSFSWRLKVPDDCGFLTYKAVGSTGQVSDGEEGYLPVLTRRIFVTESLPLPIRGKAGGAVTKKFEFEKLLKSGKSGSLVHQNLTVQMVSNPSWYAVMALPYLMEFPHECTEQTFNRLYANALARFIANSDPKIRRVFDQWKGTPALDSPLEKNQDLKSVMLEETPWLRQANSESQVRRNVGILFDANRLDSETERTMAKLAEMQLPDGSWPWFPGGRGNDYITLYITTGFGRLRHLGADLPVDAAIRSLNRLDAWMDERYREILRSPQPEKYVPSSLDALYLYGRSFFLKDKPVAAPHKPAVDFFLARSRDHWLKVNDRQSQGHLAIALRRFNSSTLQRLNDSTPTDIMRSIKERSVTNEEMGMFWRETELSWWWYRAPIETQAMMIEAFDEVMGDKDAVEECRVWLLKQKQTQDWKTTKATADAVYALLLRGKDILASDTLVEVTVGGINLTPGLGKVAPPTRNSKPETQNPAIEAGTGFYERRFAAADIKPKLGEITVKKLDEGVAWGSVHWQYFEDMSKVTPHEGTPLKLKKALFTKVNTKKGSVLEPVKGAVQVGDELVVRIELRVDRDMEYIHLKDQRGSGTEPVNVLSRYKYQDGLAYYETTRDTASHFFIDYLPKGVYVFEYSTRVQHRGEYQTGIADIQCMYAPEFNSHSESLALKVN
jgi:uncharacterized protein YfaS (alpha-2-macroglobulin family)